MRKPRLTIGMACYDDFNGVYFTITSLMIHHAEVIRDCEIVVVDNHPGSPQGQQVGKWLRSRIRNGRYFRFEGQEGTAQARNEVFRRARAEAVLCIDCHVMLVPGAVRKLIDYYDTRLDCQDLLSGPLISDTGRVGATHQQPVWRSGAWGIWSIDERGRDPDGEPFEVWQQGMGLFSCRKDAWVGFHPDFRGFGGCESYIMEKVRRSGGRVLCCPWLRWTHRFQRPDGLPYRVDRRDTIRNYLIGFDELDLDPRPVLEHFDLSQRDAQRLIASTKRRTDRHQIAVIGSKSYVGVHMRGHLLGRHLKCELLRPWHVPGMARYQTIIAIKRLTNAAALRAKCERLIYDPLDAFSVSRQRVDPVDYWRLLHGKLQFDDILATSPACRDIMQEALPEEIGVHLVPHPSDPRIREDWRDPRGPVVYAGLTAFIRAGRERIEQACRMIGKELIVGSGWQVLRGASLALALRLPPYDTPLYRCCKPQIKLENAAAAGLPVVATDCPAATSLHPAIETVPVDFSPPALAEAMQRALDGPGLSNPFTNEKYLGAMDRILKRTRKVVYTAVFGCEDELREPRQRLPGVQYICFTDNPYLKSKVWNFRYCKSTGDPLLQAKRLKVLAHEALDCDLSLWIDGRVELVDLNGIFDSFQADVGLQKHRQRDCIYQEAGYCKAVGRGDPARIDDTIARFRAAGHPVGGGLWWGGVILRRHTPRATAFNVEWWRELKRGTSWDQLILPVILRRLGTRSERLPEQVPRCQPNLYLE